MTDSSITGNRVSSAMAEIILWETPIFSSQASSDSFSMYLPGWMLCKNTHPPKNVHCAQANSATCKEWNHFTIYRCFHISRITRQAEKNIPTSTCHKNICHYMIHNCVFTPSSDRTRHANRNTAKRMPDKLLFFCLISSIDQRHASAAGFTRPSPIGTGFAHVFITVCDLRMI